MSLELTPLDDIKSLSYAIQNIVVKSSLNIEEPLDLRRLSMKIKNAEYNSERFPGLFVRFRHPKSVIIVFKNGKLILIGLKAFDQINLTLNRLILKLNSIFGLKIDINSIKPQVVNIVITANYYKQINLDLAALRLDNAIYEPEVFPGLIYNSSNPLKSVFLIFSTGKVVFTGIREKDKIEVALIKLRRLLKKENLFLTA
ncbi:MAG: TATA-box-binding protein [Promethearchaeota archaeon]|nr:MAG: TATA-box-binding protein [Candidatus Lokiarchaeota archaeon]